MTGIDQLERIL